MESYIAAVAIIQGSMAVETRPGVILCHDSVQFSLFIKCRIDKTQSYNEIDQDKVH